MTEERLHRIYKECMSRRSNNSRSTRGSDCNDIHDLWQILVGELPIVERQSQTEPQKHCHFFPRWMIDQSFGGLGNDLVNRLLLAWLTYTVPLAIE